MSILDGPATPNEVSATRDGRVTIPAQLRRAAGIEPGSRLVLYLDHGRVVIEERTHLLTRVQQEAIDAATAAGVTGSAVDELLADRRAEAARDATDPPTSAVDGGTP
ncbi:hypothetical protein GCM10009613_18480 [Pseudonocardia kongjuensis]|uniref:SpoVT-AbrB domain-containing protein n=1 Tax=Pseudonocardia kongjuensis TaxID=102227 RepID=A0ABP4IGB1_9PSEU